MSRQFEGRRAFQTVARATALVILLCVAAAGCAVKSRPVISPAKMAEFWQEPTDIGLRDLVYGAGGATLAPNPHDRYTVLKIDNAGFSPGYDVEDERGQKWSVKLGPEARTEVVVSRLVWAMGYHQPYVYYVPSWTFVDDGQVKTEGPARFRLESTHRNLGAWSWRNNPFLDTQPFAGAFVLMAMVNNWDLKTPQNVIYRVEQDGDDGRDRYVIKDLGASLGKTNWWLPGTRDDIEGFEQEPFIEGVLENRVTLHFKGAWREPQLIDIVRPNDVRWMCERLARLTSAQWVDAFRAGGYTDSEASRFIQRLREKIEEGLRLRPQL